MHSLQKTTKKEIKFQSKPWINKDILVPINEKNKIYRKFCQVKNIPHRQQLHKEFKI